MFTMLAARKHQLAELRNVGAIVCSQTCAADNQAASYWKSLSTRVLPVCIGRRSADVCDVAIEAVASKSNVISLWNAIGLPARP